MGCGMNFRDYFASGTGPIVSFEVFPPKTAKAQEQLDRVLPRLLALKPAYMTVTYGALGSTQERTIEIAARIKKELGFEVASHLTCVGSSREEIDRILDRLTQNGIENIVALRGDPPKGAKTFVPPEGGFCHASELVAHIKQTGRFGIAVAGYPEKHVEAPNLDTDLAYLKQKVEAGGDIVITQLFYDNARFFAFEKKLRSAGITAPLVPGLLPIQSFSQVQRIASLCGAKIPRELEAELEAAGQDAQRVEEAGNRWAVAQCRELLEHGVPGFHFYVLNRAAPMEKILAELG
jgi:methylenetetrahydrofolate reductase (NADPH)